MGFITKAASTAIGLTTGVSPWLMVGLFLAGGAAVGTGVGLWYGHEVDGLRSELKGVQVERDIYQASADAQAAAVLDRGQQIARLNARITGLVTAWQNTRADAERLAVQSKARGAAYSAAERKLKEISGDPKADPADIAHSNFECLQRLKEAGSPGNPGAC